DFLGDLKIALIDKRNAMAFEDIKVHVRFKLFALWGSLMFFYIYGDYFELYQPGKLQKMIAGSSPLGSISQWLLVRMSAVMVSARLMLVLALVLPVGVNRWMNIVFGTIYTVIMILAIRGAWHFYIFFGLIEIALTVLIVWYAWTWPKHVSD